MMENPVPSESGTPPGPGQSALPGAPVGGEIRLIMHDIANPLGVVRMATYYLQTGTPDESKRKYYYKLIAQSLDKIDEHLKRLRGLVVQGGEGEPGGNRKTHDDE